MQHWGLELGLLIGLLMAVLWGVWCLGKGAEPSQSSRTPPVEPEMQQWAAAERTQSCWGAAQAAL